MVGGLLIFIGGLYGILGYIVIMNMTLIECQIRLAFSSNIIIQISKPMSEVKPSPSPKADAKSSIKKRLSPALSKAAQSKSKSKAPEVIQDVQDDNGLSELTNVEAQVEEKVDQQLLSKSSKKEALKHKNEVMFAQKVAQAEKSEKSAKMMKSFDKNTTIKENHNTVVESNQREFSHNKEPEENLSVSKKKITTESKKSKVVETGTKHSKTETKNDDIVAVNEIEIKEQIPLNSENVDVSNTEKIEEKPQEENLVSEIVEPKRSTRKTSKESKTVQLKESEVEKDTKMSKNLKRSEVSKTEKEVEEEKNMKKSKSIKQAKSEAKSKDSKQLNAAKSGAKKSKPNERWH